MMEYTVHFQKGTRVGTRSLRMVHVVAANEAEAYRLAREEFTGEAARGYRHIRTDHFDPDTGRLVIDQ